MGVPRRLTLPAWPVPAGAGHCFVERVYEKSFLGFGVSGLRWQSHPAILRVSGQRERKQNGQHSGHHPD